MVDNGLGSPRGGVESEAYYSEGEVHLPQIDGVEAVWHTELCGRKRMGARNGIIDGEKRKPKKTEPKTVIQKRKISN
jgi:hypothetical protein